MSAAALRQRLIYFSPAMEFAIAGRLVADNSCRIVPDAPLDDWYRRFFRPMP